LMSFFFLFSFSFFNFFIGWRVCWSRPTTFGGPRMFPKSLLVYSRPHSRPPSPQRTAGCRSY
jgi:hypothetical protein